MTACFCQGVSIRQGAFIREGLGILYNFNSIEGGIILSDKRVLFGSGLLLGHLG